MFWHNLSVLLFFAALLGSSAIRGCILGLLADLAPACNLAFKLVIQHQSRSLQHNLINNDQSERKSAPSNNVSACWSLFVRCSRYTDSMAFVSQDAGRGWPSARRRRRADANQTQPQMYQDGPTLLFAPDGTSAARYVYIEYPAVEPNGFRQYQQQVAYHDPQAFPPPAADVPHDINPATGLRNAATLDQHILQCLCIQSDRCKHVVKRLCKLQKFVSRLDMACFGATIHELKSTRRLLLQLADYFELFPLRLHFVLFYVNATLGSLRCSIDLMTSLLSERSLLPRSRWPHLIKVFTHETGGAYMPPLRFHMYNDFLTKLASFLSG